jgi:threonine dehydratase
MTSSPASDLPVSLADVRAAAERLRGKAVRTPLLEVAALDQELGFRLLVKAEPLQRTGSFKFRGAYNTIAQLAPAARQKGVVAFSSGNHAQGVAAAAKLLDMHATIVMPSDAPLTKRERTKSYGADVVLYDRDREDREAIARRIADERGATTVKPFDDPRVIAGQGTAGLEIAEQAAEAGIELDAVIVNCSGGGLVTGCAVALAALSPKTEIYSSEPAEYDDMARSLAAGTRQSNPPGSRSFCDALMSTTPGEITFPIARRLLAGGFSADDAAVAKAMALAFDRFKLVIEPGGAVALACALQQRDRFRGRTVVAVASGGNVDRATFAKAIAA